MDVKRICVFTGSSPGAKESYAEAARRLAEEIVKRGFELVYGGADVGLMGIIADHVLECGGRVVGVIPESLVEWEVAHANLTQLHVVNSMHERKARMADLSCGFIALPGGVGTLEEMFEVLTWAQLGMHDKPCGLLNVDGYYDPLIAFLDRSVGERFLKQVHRDLLLTEVDASALLDAFERYRAPKIDKWVDRSRV